MEKEELTKLITIELKTNQDDNLRKSCPDSGDSIQTANEPMPEEYFENMALLRKSRQTEIQNNSELANVITEIKKLLESVREEKI